MAVVFDVECIGLVTQFDPCHVAQQHLRAARIHPQQNVRELVRRLQIGGAYDGGIELLVRDRRLATEFAGSHLDVLRLDCRADVVGSQAVIVQLCRVEPDAHGVLRAEKLEIADPGGAADRILYRGGDEVAKVCGGHGPIDGHEADDDEEVFRRLRNLDALLLHRQRQAWLGELQLVLHLHLGNVRVGALIEAEGDGDAAVLVALGREIQQMIEAAELLFDHLHNRALHRLGGRAGIGDGD